METVTTIMELTRINTKSEYLKHLDGDLSQCFDISIEKLTEEFVNIRIMK